MSTEMSPKMLEEYCKENLGKGDLARAGVNAGWRSFRLDRIEIIQYETLEYQRRNNR